VWREVKYICLLSCINVSLNVLYPAGKVGSLVRLIDPIIVRREGRLQGVKLLNCVKLLSSSVVIPSDEGIDKRLQIVYMIVNIYCSLLSFCVIVTRQRACSIVHVVY
jgi:hypothetical protein